MPEGMHACCLASHPYHSHILRCFYLVQHKPEHVLLTHACKQFYCKTTFRPKTSDLTCIQAALVVEKVPEDSNLAAHLSGAPHVPTAEDLAADLAHRQSDAISSTAPAQVCLHSPPVPLGMLCYAVLCTIPVLCFAVHIEPC